ncbi:hypothetical protein EBR66_01900 [bacterium]|nr:hypothetical protein [bacterium]
MKRAFLVLILVPFFASAQSTGGPSALLTQPGGLGNCSRTGAYSMSVGAFSAIGGVYVPVNDAAVTLNTGYLVYKECILRPAVNKQREAITAEMVGKAAKRILNGRDGGAYYLQRFDEATKMANKAAARAFEIIQPQVKPEVLRASAKRYVDSQKVNLECPKKATAQSSAWQSLANLRDERCDEYRASLAVRSYVETQVALAQECFWKNLQYGEGFYPVTEEDPDSVCEKILTPASVVRESFQNIISSPTRQAEAANDVGQLISPLFANLESQAIGSEKGLEGLLQAAGGLPSYIDRMMRESASGARVSALNIGISILNAYRQIESDYLAAKTSIKTAIENAKNQLRSAESQCWSTIISKVCQSNVTSQNTCTDATGTTLRIATTTSASQAVIDSQITPIVGQVDSDITKSRSALDRLNAIAAGLTSGNSTTQAQALAQLDALAATNSIHNQYDLQQARQQRDDATNALSTLVQDAIKAWQTSTDVTTGWCNVDNAAVITRWKNQWK